MSLTPEQMAAIDEMVDAMPPFTPEQRARLRPLLAGTIPPRKQEEPAA